MTRQRVLALILAAFFSIPTLAGEGPDQELDKARQHIQAKQFREAILILEEALPQTDSLAADIQTQARTAIHFYAAVALSALERDDEALSHLQEVLRLSPNIRGVDPAKYDARFVALFTRARADIVESGRFEELYPSFASNRAGPEHDMAIFGDNPALQILGSRAEKREWQATGIDRDRFLSEFWRARDHTPETERNEFRETFEHRVAFADSAFSSPARRGALTDRGRVFILLGEPAQVRRRAIDSNDRIQPLNVGSVGIVGGTIEYWFYTRDQLPVSHSKPTVTYRFVSHQGIGQDVLQKDGMAMNILAMAQRAAVAR